MQQCSANSIDSAGPAQASVGQWATCRYLSCRSMTARTNCCSCALPESRLGLPARQGSVRARRLRHTLPA